MNSISKQAKTILSITTCLWSLIILIISFMIYSEIQINTFHSFEIMIEFSKGITLWYILSVFIAYIIDTKIKKH